MKKINITPLLLLLMVLSCSSGPAPQTPDEPTPVDDGRRHVVILSMDAFRWDLASMADTPTLDSLRQVGTYAETYPVYPANTFPSHYSMATGLHPDHHGIVNNTFYDRQMQRQYSITDKSAVQNAMFYGGEPIWNTLERQGGVANIFMWVGSEAPVNGRYATVWTPYDDSFSFEERADWVLAALSGDVERIPDLIMWYFEEPDATEHKYSSTSSQTRAMVERIDRALHYFFARVKDSPVYDNIDFIVTADHGMTTLSQQRYINLYPLLDNSQIDYYYNTTPLFLEPSADYVDQAYDIISRQEHIKVYRREDFPEKYHYGTNTNRIMPLVVMPDAGWKVSYSQQDFTVKGGAHGYSFEDRDMHMVFYASGPDFKKGYTQTSFQNHNIYLIMCHLLGIEPATNDCSWDEIKDMFVEQ